ncbi:Protein kinase domain [Pelomyxa schiedti]|nr:Protein kinase domain [Pelomyxa schiedti]
MAFFARVLGQRQKVSTGPQDAAMRVIDLLKSLPERRQQQPGSSTLKPTALLDPNFTRQIATLLSEFDDWKGSRSTPQTEEFVSWIISRLVSTVRWLAILPVQGSKYGSHLFDSAPFVIYMLLWLLEKLNVEREMQKEAGLTFLNEVVSPVSDAIWHSPSSEEDFVFEKDKLIISSLEGLQQDDPSLFDLLMNLLAARCSNETLMRNTFLNPQHELQLQIFHLALHYVKGIQNESQFLSLWNKFFLGQFIQVTSATNLFDFFHRPPVLYKQISTKLPPMVSITVLQGAVKLIERSIKTEAIHDLVIKNIFWVCPGGFSVPNGSVEVTQELCRCYCDLLNLTIPAVKEGETNAQRLGLWWSGLECITVSAGLEDLGQKQALIAPFFERTLQYGLEAVRSTLPGDTLKFFDTTVTHFLKSSPPSPFSVVQQIPIKFLELEILRSILEKNALVWGPTQIGWLLDKYAQLLVSQNSQSGDPRPKFLPLQDLLYKSFNSSFINIVPFIRIALYCPEYSNLFSFEDDHDLIFLKDIMKDVDVKPLSRQFPKIVRSLFECEMERPEQRQSQLFLLMLKAIASLIVSTEMPPGLPISTQLCTLGGWLESHFSNLSKEERESSIVIAVLRESVCPRCMMGVDEVTKLSSSVLSLFQFKDLALIHPFFENYEAGCQQLHETIREQVDKICDRRVTLQEAKDFAGEQQLPRLEVETTQYSQLVDVCKTLFPKVALPDMRKVYDQFLELKNQIHDLQTVRKWLGKNGRVHLRPVEFDINSETVTLCDLEQRCTELRKSIPLREQPFNALKYFLVKKSAFFKVYFMNLTKRNYGEKDVPPGDLEEIVGSVARELQLLAHGTVGLNQVKDLQKAAATGKNGSTEEGQIIHKFFSEKGQESLNFAHFLQEGLDLIRFLEFIPSVVYCCKQFNLCIKAADDLLNLYHSLTKSPVSLETIPQHIEDLKKQFEDILPKILQNSLEPQNIALQAESPLYQPRSSSAEMQRVLEQERALNTERNKSLTLENSALEQIYTLEMANNLEVAICVFQKGAMALVELNELDLTRATFIANGSFGTVCKVPVVLSNLVQTTGGPHRLSTEVAVKMMFNYSAGMKTLQLKTQFQREYELLVTHPHWCFTNVFSHFQGDTLLSLIEEKLRGDYTVMDANCKWVSGCRQGGRAITVYQRTTYMTMELGKCTLESIISSKFSSIQHQHSVLDTARDLLQLAFCVLCAVDHLNSRGWFHCDIKSDNILLMERPHIKGNIWALCDFGTAVFCEGGNPLVLPPGESFSGNPGNRSPEVTQQLREFPLLKNDVWAVGCVLFQAVAGWNPLFTENQVNISLIRNTALPPLIPEVSSLSGNSDPSASGQPDPISTPSCVGGLVGWLLERDPSRRPTSHEALLACGALFSLPLPLIMTFLDYQQQIPELEMQQPQGAPLNSPTQPQPIPEDLVAAMHLALLQVHKQNLTDIFQRNGRRFGVDVVPSMTSPTFQPFDTTVKELIKLVYCNMALRDVPAAARALFAFLNAASSPLYNLNILS